ncbi:hypothetical protein LWX53_02875 [bacterium]|nr:hypothetical protein [bacterium]
MNNRSIGFAIRGAAILILSFMAAATPAAQEKSAPWVEVDGTAVYEAGAYGEEITKRGFSPNASLSFGIDAGYFGLLGKLRGDTNQKYGPELADIPGGEFFGIYAFMEEGGIFSKIGPLSLKAGRFRHYDVVDSPYSLFVNSNGISSNIMDIAWDDGFFSYESRWIELNHDSSQNTPAWSFNGGFPERGANIKTYAFRVGEMRFGFQDAAVYTGKNFDPEYFLNPLPQYFIQYAKSTGGRPWATGRDENDIVGFFWTFDRPGSFSLLAQVLIDDFNLHFLFPDTVWNPWQAAFNLGGRLETSAGSFGLYVAGATKYTFEPSEMNGADTNAEQIACSYGYSYYPETRFDYDWQTTGFQPGAIAIEDNMIGYKYGENNIAVRADWRGKSAGFDLAANAEFRLAGANSPANPWHDFLDNPVNGTHWLDDAVLEKRLMVGFSASRGFDAWTVGFSALGGVAFDAMELRAPTVAASPGVSLADSNIWIYEPVAGNTKMLLKLSLGAKYRWRLR